MSNTSEQPLDERISAMERRLEKIERRLGIIQAAPPAEERPASAAPPVEPQQPLPPPIETAPPPPSAEHPPAPTTDIETIIGGHWLNRIGIAAVLIGTAYFLKYAFENEWIGPKARVGIGIAAGIAMLVWSERFEARGHRFFSYSLKVLGVGVLYLSLWASSQFYHFIPNTVAFLGMAAITATMIVLALRHRAEFIAALALIGGFLTPLLLATGTNRALELFSYILLLDAGALVLLARERWPGLLLIAFAGTPILYYSWYENFYTGPQLVRTATFGALVFLIFAAVPLLRRWETPSEELSPIVLLLPFANALSFFIELRAMLEGRNHLLAGISVALAALFVALAAILLRREEPQRLASAHLAIAIGFLTIAIPLRFDAHWITIGWLAEAAALLWLAGIIPNRVLRILGVAALLLGVLRLLFVDDFRTELLLLNMRSVTYGIAIAIFAAIAVTTGRSGQNRSLYRLAVISLNALALIALTAEASEFFHRGGGAHLPTRRFARDFTYSAAWMLYGAGLMTVGFRRQNSFLRWLALALIGVTVAKVFSYDLSQLERVYRILSFIALGVILLAISFAYQRKWLELPR